MRLSGGPVTVAEQVDYNPVSYAAAFSASDNGVLAYQSGAAQADQLVWFDRAGKRLGTVGEPGRHTRPALSPDEKHVAVDLLDPQTGMNDIWRIELASGVSTRLTFDSKDDVNPVWSSDGGSIAFASNRDGYYDLYRKTASGSGKDESLLKSGHRKAPTDWSADGRFVRDLGRDLGRGATS